MVIGQSLNSGNSTNSIYNEGLLKIDFQYQGQTSLTGPANDLKNLKHAKPMVTVLLL